MPPPPEAPESVIEENRFRLQQTCSHRGNFGRANIASKVNRPLRPQISRRRHQEAEPASSIECGFHAPCASAKAEATVATVWLDPSCLDPALAAGAFVLLHRQALCCFLLLFKLGFGTAARTPVLVTRSATTAHITYPLRSKVPLQASSAFLASTS